MSDNNQTVDYYIAPKESFEATADAIRSSTGTNLEIEWKQNGFADALSERRYTIKEIMNDNWTSHIVTNTTTLKPSFFKNCTTIVSITANNITDLSNLKNEVFAGCTNLESLQMASLTTLQNTENFCKDCSKLTSVYLPKLVNAGNQTFLNCSSLVNIALPSCNNSYYIFKGCSSLEKVDYGMLTSSLDIKNYNFQNCHNLNTLILRGSTSLANLVDLNVFTLTPFASGGTGGTIYIPEVLYNHLGDGTELDYQSATNWSVIYSYGTITWAKIEGSPYENTYVDGTPVGGVL